MEIKTFARATSHVAVSRALKTFIILFVFLIFGPTSLGATFNGEEIAETSSVNDNYYGIETMKNILDDLGVSYDNTTILAYTYYANQALKGFQENYYADAKVVNICFVHNGTYLIMVPGNGSFSNSIPYIYVKLLANGNAQMQAFESWNKNGQNIIGANTKSPIYYRIFTNGITKVETTIDLTNGQLTEDVIKINKALSPISTYAIAGWTLNTGYGWYFLGNNIRFSKVDTPGTGESGDTGSGDTGSGDIGSGESGGNNISLEMTNQKIDQLNQHAEQILENMPTSGDMQNIISGEVGKITETITKPADFDDKKISSGDIIGAIGYEPPDDPYANFWFELTKLLNNAFTESVREIKIKGYTQKEYTIKIDNLGFKPNDALRTFLTLASTAAVGIAIIKWTTTIVEKISSGSMDEVLEANEEGICNLF